MIHRQVNLTTGVIIMHPSTATTVLPSLYQNRLLNRLALLCLGGLIQRINDHYRRWCESLERHSQALEQGTRVTVDRYQQELNELRRDREAQDTALRHLRSRETRADERCQQLEKRLQALETERQHAQEHLARAQEDNTRLQQRLLETEGQVNALQQQLAGQQNREQTQARTLRTQQAKLRELLTLIDTFRQERTRAMGQHDQQAQAWRDELADTRHRLQERELELENLRRLLQRQEALLEQRAAQPATRPGSAIPTPVMRRLLQLCHPDKHGGSEAALEATRWLTTQKSQHRQPVH